MKKSFEQFKKKIEAYGITFIFLCLKKYCIGLVFKLKPQNLNHEVAEDCTNQQPPQRGGAIPGPV